MRRIAFAVSLLLLAGGAVGAGIGFPAAPGGASSAGQVAITSGLADGTTPAFSFNTTASEWNNHDVYQWKSGGVLKMALRSYTAGDRLAFYGEGALEIGELLVTSNIKLQAVNAADLWINTDNMSTQVRGDGRFEMDSYLADGTSAPYIFESESTFTGTNAIFKVNNAAGASTLFSVAPTAVTLAAGVGINASAVTAAVRLGAATATLGFFGVTAAARTSAWTMTYNTASRTSPAITSHAITDNSTGTASTTVLEAQASTGGVYANVGPVANNFATLAAELALVKADLLATKKNVVQLQNDLATYGLEQ